MKRKVSIWVVALLLLIQPMFSMNATFNEADAGVRAPTTFKKVNYDNDDPKKIERDLQKIIDRLVPVKYHNAFNYYTTLDNLNDTIDLRIQLLATGWVESEWTPATSKLNKDGSYDIGYLQLNSKNIADSLFNWKFEPKYTDKYNYDRSDIYEKYLIMCIKLYKSLYLKYGDEACYSYNGGEGNYLNNTIPVSTYNYRNNISREVDNLIDELATITVERKVEESHLHSTLIKTVEHTVMCKKSKFDMHSESDSYSFLEKANTSCVIDDKRLFKRIRSVLAANKVQVNMEYVYVGTYKKNTGDNAPVFLHRLTGKLLYC